MTFVVDVIRRARGAGLSQRDVARIVGVSPQSPANWMQGRVPKNITTLNRLLYLSARLNEMTPEQRGILRNAKARRAWVSKHEYGQENA